MNNSLPIIHATTVLGVLHNGQVALGADGQATMGNTVAKSNVKKVRQLQGGKVLAGFAGSTADAFTLIERFEDKLNEFRANMKRSAIALAKDWRTDRYLRRLEAMLIAADENEIPRRFSEDKNTHIIDYLTHTYVNKTIDTTIFNLPSYCNTTCPSTSVCGKFREQKSFLKS